MDHLLYERILDFIESRVSWPREELIPERRLVEDFGLTGPDAIELMEQFARTFGVDMTGYKWEDYFHTDAFDPLSFFSKDKPKRELTMADLYSAASSRHWPIRSITIPQSDSG